MRSWSPAKRGRVILTVILLIIVFALVMAARSALFPFLFGIFLIYVLLPAVNFLHQNMPRFLKKRNLGRPLAILLIYLGIILLLVGFFAIFVPIVSDQISQLVEASQEYTMLILQWTREIDQTVLTDLLARFYEYVPDVVEEAIRTNLEQLTSSLSNALQDLVTWFVGAIQRAVLSTFSAVTSTVGFVLALVLIPFWVFYMLNDERKISASVYSAIPQALREDVLCLESIIGEALGSYLRGQLLLALIVGVMSTVGLLILGVNFSVLLGTIAGIFEIIPNIGPFLGAIPAVLVALLKSPTLAFQVAILFFVIQQIENTLLAPKVVGASVQLHPTVIMVVLVVGNELAGIWGMILGVPITAIVRDVVRYLYLRFSDEEITPQEALLRVHPPRKPREEVMRPWQRKALAWSENAWAQVKEWGAQAFTMVAAWAREAAAWLWSRLGQIWNRIEKQLHSRATGSDSGDYE